MIRCMNRLEEHQKGEIRINGTPLDGDSKHIQQVRRDIGMVFQQFNLFPHLTVLRNLTLAPMRARNASQKEAEERARHYLERVRIPEQARQIPESTFPAANNNASLSREACACNQKSCCSTNPRQRSIRK